jgi:hypothetical protein
VRAGLFSRPAQVNSPGNASATFGNERVQRVCPRRGSRIPTETRSVHVADVVIRDRRCGCYPCQIPRLDGCETSAQTHQGREHEQAMPTRSADSASMVRASERSDRRLDAGMPGTKQLWACPLSYGECDHRSNWCRGIVIQTTRVAKGRDDQERHTGRTPPRSWTGYGRAPCRIA